MRIRATLAALSFVLLGVVPAQAQAPSREERIVSRWTSPDLVTFTGDAEFRRYLSAIKAAGRTRGLWWARGRHIQFAQSISGTTQSDAAEPLCPDGDPACMGEADSEIVLTGSRVASNPSITNNQQAGVDEGDIVKQIGQFLLVLQDGRIFSIDTRAGPSGAELALVDRANVYRNPDVDTWYDEMLVQDDRVIVTGYSYDESASEVSVFRLDPRGRLSREGTFYLSSNDYYDTDNYATRIVGDRLVVYTPMWLQSVNPLRPVPWPVVRRWTPEEERERAGSRGDRLFDARTIYRPVRDTFEPVVHTVSVCPLGSTGEGRAIDCRTTAFVGPPRREFYVTTDSVYLWISADEEDRLRDSGEEERTCPADARFAPADTTRSLLYRVPLSGEAPEVLGTAGRPIDQFSFLTTDGRFHALLRWPAEGCEDEAEENGESPPRLAFFRTLLGRLGGTLIEAPAAAYVPVPSVGTAHLENRFTDTHLVYGGRERWLSRAPEENETVPPSRVVALAIDRAAGAQVLELPHSVIRAERVGDDIVLTGYRDDDGLRISLIDLGGTPRLASTAFLPRRFESEGRSHAFNSLVERDGSGLMGLPTVFRAEESDRWWWRSQASDVSFLSLDRGGRIASIGELTSGAGEDADGEDIPGYECEVSCIDWYGNSRPIFTDGRVFGLTGTELVEGRIENGRIREIRRLNIAVPAR